ncbi:hypothetical protein HHL16_13570 [Pseudoflavitalea sp. G-6-1-2]|uniref:hypothetical protein n=1 Tax=Pseudoflavitalea sp. G-6-1-2 TaxID=2728841 RepID=UPI00146E0642|nr:hypothetical protein [Pseudoflavitalea sp. G-6-1-2]NML21913.1 hypothetical protein [Pseudoflavitalea sp. G-6-1-2]
MKKLLVLTAFFAAAFQVSAQTKETLSVATLKLNGKLSLPCKLSDVVKLLGLVTYTNPEALECGSFFPQEAAESHVIRIKGFDIEKNRDSVFYHSIDLVKSPDAFITWSGGRFDRNTTLEQMSKQFPVSAKQAKKNGGTTEMFLELDLSSDDVFKFDFKGGKLIRISYWGPC